MLRYNGVISIGCKHFVNHEKLQFYIDVKWDTFTYVPSYFCTVHFKKALKVTIVPSLNYVHKIKHKVPWESKNVQKFT